MRFYFVIVFALSVSLFVAGCQKELDPYISTIPVTDSTGTVDSTNTGDSTGTVTDTNSVDSYHPVSTGSFWKYIDTASQAITTNTIGSLTRTNGGILYKALISVSDVQTDTLYVASPKPDYYLLAQGLSPSGAVYDLTFHYLNDTAAVGKSWTYNAGSGNGFTANVTTTIIARDVTMTVEGKTYSNVIQTHLVLSYDAFGTSTAYGDYNYFIAKGIGIIKIRSVITSGGIPILQTCSNLTDYEIK